MGNPSDFEIESRLSRARELVRAGKFAQALQQLLLEATQSEQSLILTGVCQARLRQREEAKRTFSTLLEANPQCFEALTWMAALQKNRIEIQEAIEHARRAIEVNSEESAGYGSLGACYLFLRNSQGAIDAFRRAVELDPEMAEHRHNLGLSYLMAHRHGEAIPELRKAIDLAPGNHESYLTLAGAYSLYGMSGEAIAVLEKGLSVMPDSAPLHSAAAGAFAAIRNDQAAENHHLRAVQLSGGAQSAYATWLINQGRFVESESIFESTIAGNSDPAFAYYGIMQSRKLKDADVQFVSEMERALGHKPLGRGSEMYLRYALGRAFEQRKDFQTAMMHFDEANRLAFEVHHAGRPFQISEFRTELTKVQGLFERLQAKETIGSSSNSPIFIIGMIRSGTTLLDQIVTSHPQVTSGGELRFWIEETLRLVAKPDTPTDQEMLKVAEQYLRYLSLLAGASPKMTDKMPLNFAYTGVIHQALPNAKFLHIKRNPIDTCLSIYTTYFGQGALFGYRKSNIVAYYREYLRSMDYWRSTIPADRLIELEYEKLVADPEPQIRRIIEFCELPWDDACLNHSANQSAINTPSRWQARQPIYKGSLERWKSYEPWLGEFAELLD